MGWRNFSMKYGVYAFLFFLNLWFWCFILHFLSLFLCLCPTVTIATEERHNLKKGIRLEGAPSHLAQRGGTWGGGGRSGSMLKKNKWIKAAPPPCFPLLTVTCELAAPPSVLQVELWGCMSVLCHQAARLQPTWASFLLIDSITAEVWSQIQTDGGSACWFGLLSLNRSAALHEPHTELLLEVFENHGWFHGEGIYIEDQKGV